MIIKFYEGGTEFCTEVFISCRKNSNNETNYAGLIFQSFFFWCKLRKESKRSLCSVT